MILTGKAKEDFEFWLFERQKPEEYYNRDFISDTCLNALIIEWFDSLKCAGYKSLWSYCFGNYDVFKDKWSEHIEKAIIKANGIYNENRTN